MFLSCLLALLYFFMDFLLLEKVIIRIKKQEQDVDIEGKDSSLDSEEAV